MNRKIKFEHQFFLIRFIYDGVYLEIEELTLNDAGRYTCVAENAAGHAEIHFQIDVMSEFRHLSNVVMFFTNAF